MEHRGFEFAPVGLGGGPSARKTPQRGFFSKAGRSPGEALKPHWGFIHFCARSNQGIGDSNSRLRAWSGSGSQATLWPDSLPDPFESPEMRQQKTTTRMGCFLVEHRGFEPLTSTLRTLRATNCANAPRMNAISIIHIREKKARIFSEKFLFSSRSTGCPSGARRGRRPPPWRRGRPG